MVRAVVAAWVLGLIAACSGDRPDIGAEGSSGSAAAVRQLNLFNYADYLDPGVIDEFERMSGVAVVYDTYDGPEMLETRLLTGGSGYDLVVVSGTSLGRLIGAGALRPLDATLLSNRANLDARMQGLLATTDPGNRHAVGYLWGTTALAYDVDAQRRVAPDAPTNSLRMLFDPEVVARFAECGVSVIDTPAEGVATALLAIGADPNDLSPANLSAAAKALKAIRPHVRKIDSDSQIGDIAGGGEACLMLTYGTNVAQGAARAREAGLAANFRYVIPDEGAMAWFDALAIPTDAPDADLAHAFMDFLLRPEIAARNASRLGATTMNAAAVPLVEPALRSDPALYPPPEANSRLHPLRERSLEESRAENRVWTDFQSGR